MAKFRDCEGKEWDLRVTIGHLRPLRELGIDLRDALKEDNAAFAETVGDPEKLGQILWVLCEAQAEKAGVTPEQFAGRFDGETIDRALAALMQGVIDFFRPGTGEKAAAAVRKTQAKLTARVGAVLDGITDAAIDRALDSRTSKSGALNSAGPSELTPARSPSAS